MEKSYSVVRNGLRVPATDGTRLIHHDWKKLVTHPDRAMLDRDSPTPATDETTAQVLRAEFEDMLCCVFGTLAPLAPERFAFTMAQVLAFIEENRSVECDAYLLLDRPSGHTHAPASWNYKFVRLTIAIEAVTLRYDESGDGHVFMLVPGDVDGTITKEWSRCLYRH